MIKTVIVDDDIEMLDWLEQMVPWEEYGFTIVARALNGLEAIDICKEQMPDLIITDITMPSISGLDLVSEVKKIKPDIRSVILTCHEDFNFAQRALKLEADDYIIKYSITSKDMVEVLKKLKCKMEAERMKKEEICQLNKELLSNSIVIEEKFITDIIDGILVKREEILKKVEVLKINFPDKPYRVISTYIDNYDIDIEGCPIKEEGLLKFCVKNIAEEIMQQERGIKCFSYRRDILIMHLWDGTTDVSIKQRSLMKLKEFHSSVKQILGMNMSSCVSSVCVSLSDIGAALNETALMRDSYFFNGSGAVVVQKKSFPNEDIDELLDGFRKSFRLALNSGDKPIIMKLLEDFYAKAEDQNYTPKATKKLFSKIAIDTQIAGNKNGISFKTLKFEMDTYSALKDGFTDMVDSYFENLDKTRNSTSRKEIFRVLEYIETNLDRNITCESMAEMVSINSSYFSRLFKSEVGINFSDYLIGKRIEKATRLLEKTDLTIEIITKAVGLEQPSYFYKLYKKVTGKTPGEVRDKK